MHIASLLTSAILAGLTLAHPGHDHTKEMAERREYLATRKTNLGHCSEKVRERGLHKRALQRRQKLADELFAKRGLKKRQVSSLQKSHASSEEYTIETDLATVFSGNHSCVLSPETTEGPYYVAGESIRKDVVEHQAGVPMTIDVQVLDTETCEPVSDVYLEIWHCNSTGVYGGVLAGGNGVGPSDTTNLQNTWLRGLQATDADGAAQFHTLFPGHYSGRATHIHVMVHLDAKANENGTVINTKASHVGQMFFDQDLISRVDKLEPYNANKQALMTNARDGILLQEAATSDPFMAYVELGESLQDGLLAWLAFGVDTGASRTINAASTVYKDGAVQNARAGGAMGGPGMGGGFPGMPGGGGRRPGMPGTPGTGGAIP